MKNTSKMWKSMVIIVAVLVGGLSFSCTNEQEDITNPYEYTPEQKAEILAMAKEYGIEVTLYEGTSKEKLPTIEQVEQDLKTIVAMCSKKYPLVFDKKGKCSRTKPMKKSRLKTRSETDPEVETGSWRDVVLYQEYWFNFSITWEVPTPFTKGSAKATMISNPTYLYEQGGLTYSWYATQVLLFELKGKLNINSNRYSIVARGEITTRMGVGEVTLSSR